MRAPSSLYSTEARPVIPMASVGVAAVAASIGSTGRPMRSPTASNAPSPPVRARSAVSPRSPESIAARRTVATGWSAARAIASSSTPLSAPVRSSPSIALPRKSHSGAVARAARSCRSSLRLPAEPLPDAAASASKVWSTAAIVSSDSAECAMSSAARPRQPTPSLPWRGAASSSPTTAGRSAASARRSSCAIASILARREEVAATCSVVTTSSESSIPASSHRGRTRGRRLTASRPSRAQRPRKAGFLFSWNAAKPSR